MLHRCLPIACLLLAPSLAWAQDTPEPQPEPKPAPKVEFKGEPLMPPDAHAAPAVQQQAQPDDETPIRLSAVISSAAAVQRRARIAEGALGILAGGGGIATGAILFALPNQQNNDGVKILGGIAIGFGALTVLTSVWDLFSRGALERLDDAYAPIAHDRSIPADRRLAEGEQALEGLASAGRSSRIWSGVTSIVLGVGLGIAAAPIAFAAAPDCVGCGDQATVRAYIGLGLGISAFLMFASGVTTIVVKRTEAEQLWNLWLAGTGRPTAKLPKLQPFVGGSGVGLLF